MNNTENEIYLIDIYGDKLTPNIKEKEEEEEEEDLKGDETTKEIITAFESLKTLFKMKTWKRAFEWSKDNLSTVLIWISGLGAVIQIKELASIHVSYIRFFSVTQLISDGALVLLMTISIVIIAFVTTRYLNPKIVAKQLIIDVKKNRSFSWFEKYARYFCMFLGNVVFARAFMDITVTTIQKNVVFSIISIAFILAFFTYSAFYYAIFGVYLEKTKDSFILFSKYNVKNYYRAFNRLVIMATAISIVIIIIKSMFLIQAASRLPYSLENYNKAMGKVEADYKDLEYYKLRYFNDTYAFIEIKKKKETKSKIVVYKTDDLIF